MDVLAEPLSSRFDDFLLDREARALYRLTTGGERTVVPIGSRALEILCVLIDRRGEFVSRRVIMEAVWRNAAVEESNLTVQMAALRRVLDVGRTRGSCIQTIPGRGYRFLPQITQASTRAADADMQPPFDGQTPASVPTSPGHDDLRAAPRANSPRRMPWLAGLAGATGLFVAVLFAAYAWYYSSGSYPRGAYPRLSVAVLPFENLSGDAKDGRLADGITEDLNTDLSHIPDAFVIAREPAFNYKGKAEDVRRLGEELGVRYVVNGSLQRLGDALRINVQLTSTETGAHVWSDRFDEQFNLPTAQEHAVRKMKDELAASIVDVEAARSLHDHPADPDAFDLILRARSLRNLPSSPQRNKEVIGLLEQALSLDPTSVYAMTYIAFYLMEALPAEGWGNFESMQRAGHLLMRARSAAPDSEMVLNTYVYWLRTVGICQEATELTQQAIQANANRTRTWTGIYNELSICKTLTGHAEEGLNLQDEADRLNPLSPYKFIRYAEMGWITLMLGRGRESVMYLERSLALQHDPDDYNSLGLVLRHGFRALWGNWDAPRRGPRGAGRDPTAGGGPEASPRRAQDGPARGDPNRRGAAPTGSIGHAIMLTMLVALEQLAHGGSVSNVAYAVGYETPSSFIAAFRDSFGTTPTAYFRDMHDRSQRQPIAVPASASSEEENSPRQRLTGKQNSAQRKPRRHERCG